MNWTSLIVNLIFHLKKSFYPNKFRSKTYLSYNQMAIRIHYTVMTRSYADTQISGILERCVCLNAHSYFFEWTEGVDTKVESIKPSVSAECFRLADRKGFINKINLTKTCTGRLWSPDKRLECIAWENSSSLLVFEK